MRHFFRANFPQRLQERSLQGWNGMVIQGHPRAAVRRSRSSRVACRSSRSTLGRSGRGLAQGQLTWLR